jgi:hypothetical protein
MAKHREGDTVLLRGEVTRVDDEDETVTVLVDGLVPIRHTLRKDSSSIEASVSPGKSSGKSSRRNPMPA